MSRSISRRILLFSRGFCHFPAVSAMEGANLKADLSEKADSNMEVKGKSPNNNLVSVGEPRSAEKAAKRKTKHKGSKKQLEREDLSFTEDAVALVIKVFGYHFNNPDLVVQALTHCSYYYPLNPELSYGLDRLCLIGDSVLKLLATMELVASKPDTPHIQAKDVDSMKLASLAVWHGLHFYIRLKVPLLEDEIVEFARYFQNYTFFFDGGLSPPDILPQIVKSLIGAVYIDSNYSLQVVSEAFRYFSTSSRGRASQAVERMDAN